jgi:hypothetical protein
MRSDEVRALGRLIGGAGTAIADQARDLHAAIADQVFDALGQTAQPVRLLHDPIATAAYAGGRTLTGAIITAVAVAVGETRPDDAVSIHAGGRGRAAVAALNGAWGDRLAEEGSALAVGAAGITLHDGDGVMIGSGTVPPPWGPRVAVFVHGLGETDRAWRHRGPGAYGPPLAAAGVTPLYAHYNTGRAIAESGRALAETLTALDALLPEDVELALVGHSMGGLVIGEACRAADSGPTGPPWRGRLRAVVTLGTPYTGAPLARAVDRAERALSRLGETRALTGPLRSRSAGIRDLGHGGVLWFTPGVDHYFVSATITRDPSAPAGRLLGDLLVHRRSAWAQRTRTEPLAFPASHYRHLDGATHFDLLGHPAVAGQLVRWLALPALPGGP